MSYSNRRAHRPDPTIAPVILNPATGELENRVAWTPSAYTEARYLASKAGKRAARAKKNQTLRSSHR